MRSSRRHSSSQRNTWGLHRMLLWLNYIRISSCSRRKGHQGNSREETCKKGFSVTQLQTVQLLMKVLCTKISKISFTKSILHHHLRSIFYRRIQDSVMSIILIKAWQLWDSILRMKIDPYEDLTWLWTDSILWVAWSLSHRQSSCLSWTCAGTN